MKKQYVVIGLGRFGSTVALTLNAKGFEVLAIDNDEATIENFSLTLDHCVCADGASLDSLKALGVDGFDVAVVAMANSLEKSILTVMNLQELGVGHIIVKAKSSQESRVYEKLGVQEIIQPEKDIGAKLARALMHDHLKELAELGDDSLIVETPAPKSWIGKTIRELNVRATFNINLIGRKDGRTGKIIMSINPDDVIQETDEFIIIASQSDLAHFEKSVA